MQYKAENGLYIDNTDQQIPFEKSNLYSEIKKLKQHKNIKLVVRNVGCGNWNEIKFNDFRLIYDLGGDIKYSDTEMRSILNRIKFTKPFIGIISHWDLDHYRAIIDMDDKSLKLMKYITVPSKMPCTIQMKKTLNKLTSLGIPVSILRPAKRTGKRINLDSLGKINNFELFRSCDGSNINQSGIVITVEGNKKIGVLTGDHYYPQIYNDILCTSSPKPYELVVPHHGGQAGKFDLSKWNKIYFSSGALSTHSNRYRNLPQNSIHNFFIVNRKFHCTECAKSDYVTYL